MTERETMDLLQVKKTAWNHRNAFAGQGPSAVPRNESYETYEQAKECKIKKAWRGANPCLWKMPLA
ncbi:hypothetical protein M407DRAFT_245939 [Tulasnella calospora MUT 4182]|uniref:Uncharacterized protein n=1 Tax=Tulasnella calospora MUT 4182 TaxID=1051891 RepID=A0A0C3KF49_9AGAM|nr:hypothetical protein M407DRAFT_245939 [Tulasnella calospora MUT 4182]